MNLSTSRAAAQAPSANRNLVFANTGFGYRLLQQLSKEKPGANIFISPYSISSLLQMVSTGARGQTEQELQQVLGTTTLSTANMNSGYKQLREGLAGQTNVTLNIANALWYRTGAELNPQFVEVNQSFYGATLDALDFNAADAAKTMNDWAAQNTHGKINQIISPPIPGDTAIVLASAIYFKGTWLDQFDAKQTHPRPFHFVNGSDQSRPMMLRTASFDYQENGEFQAIQLPYVGKELAMQILLPATNSSIQVLLGKMNTRWWDTDLLAGFRSRRGTLVLPRFTLHYEADLKPPLSVLGLKSALTTAADFSGMSSSRLYLSQVKHQSFVEVNEQGTEAAAVTTGVVALASFHNEPPPFNMTVDRPFVFVISDQKTRSILFIGLVFDPLTN